MPASPSLIAKIRPNLPAVMVLGALSLAGMYAQAANLEEVTVTAPSVRVLGRDATGTPIQQVSATARVQYNPIMLTTNSGRALLDDRVADVARRLCTAGGRVSATSDDGACIKQAIEGAKAQLDAAAARVKGQ